MKCRCGSSYTIIVSVWVCERVRVERTRVILRKDFVYDYCGRGEKVKKISDGNIVREAGVWKENWDNGV